MRQCLAGEQLLSSGECSQCEEGKYLLDSQNSLTPTQCLTCPNLKATCDGGNAIYPLPGYWRSSIHTDNFIECRNKVACLGRNGASNNPLGACEVGYRGILCSDCEENYSITGSSFTCSKCPDMTGNIVKLTALCLVMIGALVFLVRSTIQGATKKKSLLSVFFRVLMNHFQLLTLTASFDLSWPEQLKSFFASSKPVSDVST